ncbi:hypothetical protein R1sor_024068 [Riccia sorocarpa]|uniref:Reverse transcriptase domain-containing protein n=1 Tax=Riccia sorocarpa TaxID=122646 RepID=A0ABD3GSG3_9MARC
MLPKVIELLKKKVRMGILEPSMALYSSRWFTVPKKSGALRFIQDLQPANNVTIRNLGKGPIVDEVADAFAGRAIYSIGDFYSGYDQFQLALESRDLTTIRTPLGLMRMCTLPQGATNSVAHMQNAMHKVLRDFVPEVNIPFVDDIPIMGCVVEEKDDSILGDVTLHILRRVVDSLSQQLMVKFCEHDEVAAETSDFEDFADCRSDGESVSDEDITRESLESSQDREELEVDSRADLIPGLPNDLVSVQIWPRIASSFGLMRTVNKEWRMFVRTTPEWIAEVVRLSEGLNERGFLIFRDSLAERVEDERQAILAFLRDVNKEELLS